MINEIKQNIILLRENGKSYGEIVSIIGVCVSTVKSVCLRYKKKTEDTSYYKYCGNKLIFVKGKKEKVFCSDKCRMNY